MSLDAEQVAFVEARKWAVLRTLTGDADLGREDPSSFVPMFDEQQRTVLRIRPTLAFMND